jgi:Fe-S cluster assembly protein SufD
MSPATLPGTAVEHYRSEYDRLAGQLPGQNLGWLVQARQAAMARFVERGLPSQRDEAWKYTSVAAIDNARFALAPIAGQTAAADALADLVAAHAIPGAHLLVFVDGRLAPTLSRPGRLPPGVGLGSLAEALADEPAGLQEALLGAESPSAFADLNLACLADGACLRLPAGTVVEAPIQWLFIASQAGLVIQPRNLVLAAAGSSAAVVEHHVALGEGRYLSNAVTDIRLDPGAAIAHHKLQQESPAAFHIAAVNVAQAAKSQFVSTSFAFGARLARVDIAVGFDAEEAACTLDGLYLTDGRQHVDHHTCIDHRQPRCTSRQLYKGVVDGASRAVFNGRVVVHPDAQGSDAWQSNHNLLLSENAEIDTKPQLEIWADDVKCSHGATVGQLAEDAVFYLRSRGIGEADARAMLTCAFAMEVIGRVSQPAVQDRLVDLLSGKLPLPGR